MGIDHADATMNTQEKAHVPSRAFIDASQ